MKKMYDGGMSRRDIRRKNKANRKAIREEKAISRQADKLLTQINKFGYDEVIGSNPGGVPMGPAEELASRLYQGQLSQAQNYSDMMRAKTAAANAETANELNSMGEGYGPVVPQVPGPYKRGGQMRDTLLNKIRFK